MFFNSYYSIYYEDGKPDSANRYVFFHFKIFPLSHNLVTALTAILVK